MSRALWLYYFGVGLLFQVLYHGFPWPLRVITWLHVLAWPLYVVLDLARWVFMPFALLSILGLLAIFAARGRTEKP